VVKKFGRVTAVDHVSFSVEEGEVVALLGPSGCGKTTTLRAIAGLDEINEGEIILDGQVVTSKAKNIFVPTEKRRLGLVFQSYALWPHMTVRQNIQYCLANKGFPKIDIPKLVSESLDLVGLSGMEHRYPSQLSGGQQQRVALARSTSYHPKVLLLDEPLSNLDLKVRERVRGELRLLLKRIGITTVFVTHDQEEAFVISDRSILMNNGKIVQQGSPNEIYSEPKNEFVADFIGHANILKANILQASEATHKARISLADASVELTCEYDGSLPNNPCLVLLRYNEIGLSGKMPAMTDNVVRGQVISREYRGAVTDHKIKVGNTQLIVTTHKYCAISEFATENDWVYLHFPPHAIKPIPLEAKALVS
jgi:iron(III) transport system ATP-binding protein